MPESSVSKSGFEILLERLGPDTTAAGQEYERLRIRLRKMFEVNRCCDADGMVDRVFERVEAKLEDLDKKPDSCESVRNILAFISGVARNVLREHWVSREFKVEAIDADLHDRRVEKDDDEGELEERRLECLEVCLYALPEKVRRQLLDYHSGRGREGIILRKQIAEEENVALENLRVRMLRARRDLEKCILESLRKKE